MMGTIKCGVLDGDMLGLKLSVVNNVGDGNEMFQRLRGEGEQKMGWGTGRLAQSLIFPSGIFKCEQNGFTMMLILVRQLR